MTQILDVREPKWIPESREWKLDYVVADVIDSKNVKYIQTVRCETLLSATKMIQTIKEKIK